MEIDEKQKFESKDRSITVFYMSNRIICFINLEMYPNEKKKKIFLFVFIYSKYTRCSFRCRFTTISLFSYTAINFDTRIIDEEASTKMGNKSKWKRHTHTKNEIKCCEMSLYPS